MKLREQKNALRDALDTLERCLETPIIPGELPDWCLAAQSAAAEVDCCLRREIEEIHPELFRQIYGEDPELGPRVESLREEDHKLLEQMQHVTAFLKRLTPAADAVEPDEVRVEEHVESAIDAGLELVLAVRKQETAITTWYLEALERDRGTVD